MPESSPESFKNIKEVAAYLVREYQVTERSVYNHAKKGYLGKKKNGVYTLTQVNKYARDWLTQKDAYANTQEEELNRIRIKIDMALKQEQLKAIKFKNEVEQGKYIPREDWERQLAGRAIVLETGIKGAFTAQVGEVVETAGGQTENTGKVLTCLFEIFDDALNQFATPMEFEIEFGEEE